MKHARIAHLIDPWEVGKPPAIPPEHLLDQEERERVAAFLNSGAILIAGPAKFADDLLPGAPLSVPTGWATDGVWLWCESLLYYVETHGLSPEQDFLGYIRAHDYSAPEPTDAAIDRAEEDLHAYFREGH